MHEDIMIFLNEQTKKKAGTTIPVLSEALQKSRNVLARSINQLVEEGTVVCVMGKEKTYYSKTVLEEIYQVKFESVKFENEMSFNQVCTKETKKDFEKLIGYSESLANCVDLCKAAISYPQNSLPVLLNGPTGTGKSLIAQLMYEYAVNQKIIEADKPFVIVNCSEYANNPELLTANLFGHKKGAFTGAESDNNGLIKAADGGVLFLDEVHCLKPECQEKLFLFMDKGIYHVVGENEKWENAQVRLIFATTEKPEDVLLKTFLRRVPIIVNVPSLQKRGLFEKIQLLYTIFNNEEKRINQSIQISNFVYNMFLNHVFEGNIGELKNTIQVCCAKALRNAKNGVVEIHMDDLPMNMFVTSSNEMNSNFDIDHRMIAISDLNINVGANLNIIKLYDQIIDGNYDEFEKVNQYFDEYQRNLLYDRKDSSGVKDTFIMNRLETIIQDNLKKYGYRIDNNDLLTLFYYIEDTRRNLISVRGWCQQNALKIGQFDEIIKHKFPHEYSIVSAMIDSLNMSLDITFDEMFPIVLTLFIHLINSDDSFRKRLGIILAHGYSTASSIAHATNQMLNDTVFQALDMPIDMTTEEIVEELNLFLSKHTSYEELVFLVDMGSLEQIYKGISEKLNVNIGIINNITTKIALEIGLGIKMGTPLNKLLKDVCEASEFKYKIIERKQKEDVIACVCASGLGTAERIKQLLVQSLPASAQIKIITYDYNTITTYKDKCDLFEKYNVLCIVGTLNPSIDNVLFVGIEDLIVNQNIDGLQKIISQRLNENEIEAFNHELLKCFSLSSVMDHLTILNPAKLLEHIAKAIDDFQGYYGVRISNSTSVGLYVHTCCMIERLVTRQSFENYPNIEILKEAHAYFFECVKRAFKPVENYYKVSLSDDEIGYVYDYIHNGDVDNTNEF